MFQIFLIAAYIILVESYPKDNFANEDFEKDFFGAESNTFENLASYNSAFTAQLSKGKSGPSDSGDNGKLGYSAGSGLRSIAQGSAEQAHTATQNQEAAGHQAAYVAKNTLAQAANAASATAQAALAGKQIILQGLEQQHRDAIVALQGEKQQLQQAQRAAVAAQQTAQQAQRHVQVLTAALNVAQATSEGAGQAASEAAGELAAQVAMVGAAQQRLEALTEQLHGARIDFEATQAAAQKAQTAALQAQSNAAQAAAAAAAASGVKNAHHNDGSNHGGVLPVPPQGNDQPAHLVTYINADYDY
ncbi:hypothetical protein RN001_015739 [Aquatica leii]|uniref:Uncharacterized protein n=1 Tax=Aquatica leii TaxID=1421715 RepID=A0AAN7NTM5_9COLE|nr:hypothetical protein RN001_015739 [Aquatica leii]